MTIIFYTLPDSFPTIGFRDWKTCSCFTLSSEVTVHISKLKKQIYLKYDAKYGSFSAVMYRVTYTQK